MDSLTNIMIADILFFAITIQNNLPSSFYIAESLCKKPNFLIIGVGKSGTTSLYRYLKQHPDVYMCPKKEPDFFIYNEAHRRANGPYKRLDANVHAKTFEEYLKLFEGVLNEKAIGEASTTNFTERSCDRIRHYLPDAHLIAIFRHPVDRAYAQFQHRRRTGFEAGSSFLKAYRASKWRLQHGWAGHLCYENEGYVPILQHWLSRFPRQQFRFYLTDDLKADALSVMQDIFQFLEVDDHFKPDVSIRHNSAFAVRSQTLSHFSIPYSRSNPIRVFLKMVVPPTLIGRVANRVKHWNRIPAEPLDPELRCQLTKELRDNILRLQDLIGRDLSHWLETK